VFIHHLLGEFLDLRRGRLLRRQLARLHLGHVRLAHVAQVARVLPAQVGFRLILLRILRGKRKRQRQCGETHKQGFHRDSGK